MHGEERFTCVYTHLSFIRYPRFLCAMTLTIHTNTTRHFRPRPSTLSSISTGMIGQAARSGLLHLATGLFLGRISSALILILAFVLLVLPSASASYPRFAFGGRTPRGCRPWGRNPRTWLDLEGTGYTR